MLMLGLWFGDVGWMLGLIPGCFVFLYLCKTFEDKSERLKAIGAETPSDTATCVECGGVFQVENMIAHSGLHVCARCKPVFLQKLVEGANIASNSTAEPGRTKLVPLWFWLLLVIVALAAVILAFLFPITSHAPM
jgi:hypothetical protein